jgi:predicted metal-dependent phosphotriesterase family hydrolase
LRQELAGAITITLSIPASTGRTIKEITRVSANTTQTQVQGTTGLYNTAVIPGTGTTVTFNTTFTEYIAKAAGVIPTANNTELAKRFYFLITLDNGDTIIPEPVRVVVVP